MNKKDLDPLNVGDMILTHDNEHFYVSEVDERWFESFNYKITWMREATVSDYSHRYIQGLIDDGTATILRVIK